MTMVWLVSEKVTNKPINVWFAKSWAETWIAKQPRRPDQPRKESDYEITAIEMNPSMENSSEIEKFWQNFDKEVEKEDKPLSAFNSADWERWEKKRL